MAVVPKEQPSESVDEESNDAAEYELVLEEDPRFKDSLLKMKTFACYNPKKAAEDMGNTYGVIVDIEKRLQECNPCNVVRDAKKIVGPCVRYFDISVDKEGKLRIVRKNNSVSYSMNRNGMFVMFSNGVEDWRDMMSCYDCRTYVEQASQTFNLTYLQSPRISVVN